MTRLVVSVHEEVIRTGSIGEIIAVVVGETGIPQSDHFSDGYKEIDFTFVSV